MHTVVDIVFIQNWDSEYDEQKREGNTIPEFGDWAEMVEYLSQWDYGDETDSAHSREYEDDEFPWGNSDEQFEMRYNGLYYVLSYNRKLRYAGLQRRPIANWNHPFWWES